MFLKNQEIQHGGSQIVVIWISCRSHYVILCHVTYLNEHISERAIYILSLKIFV